MAEFCLDCWNKLTGTQYRPQYCILSEEPELCVGCGEWKPVLIRFRRRYLLAEWFHSNKARFSRKKDKS